jgi:hypothetical protein
MADSVHSEEQEALVPEDSEAVADSAEAEVVLGEVAVAEAVQAEDFN